MKRSGDVVGHSPIPSDFPENTCNVSHHFDPESQNSSLQFNDSFPSNGFDEKNGCEPKKKKKKSLDEMVTSDTFQYNFPMQNISTTTQQTNGSTAYSIAAHQTEQILTMDANSSYIFNNNGIICSLPYPFQNTVGNRTDRGYELKNCFNGVPRLILYGKVPAKIDVELTMRSTAKDNTNYYSIFQFKVDTEYKDILRRSVAVGNLGDDVHEIALDNLVICKPRNSKTEKLENGKKQYILKSYPSGDENQVQVDGPTIFVKQFNLTNFQVGIRLFSNDLTLLLKTHSGDEGHEYFYSNYIHSVQDVSEQFKNRNEKLIIKKEMPRENLVFFDNNNLSKMEYKIKFPEELKDMTGSGFKQMEVSLVCKDKNTIHNEYYLSENKIDINLFEIPANEIEFQFVFSICKKPLTSEQKADDSFQLPKLSMQSKHDTIASWSSTGSNANMTSAVHDVNGFHIRIRIIHVQTTPNGPKSIKYPDIPTWYSEYFIEETVLMNTNVQLSVAQEHEPDQCDQNDSTGPNPNQKYFPTSLPVYYPRPMTNQNYYN